MSIYGLPVRPHPPASTFRLPQDFSVDFTSQQGNVGVKIVGDLDRQTAPVVRSCISTCIDHHTGPTIHIDVGDVTFIDSAGLRVLVEMRRKIRSMGGELSLDYPSTPIRRILEVTLLDGVFQTAS